MRNLQQLIRDCDHIHLLRDELAAAFKECRI